MRLALCCLLALPVATVAAERTMRFTAPMYFLPPAKAIVIAKAGAPGPDMPVATANGLRDELKLADDGPFDVWFVPKDGKPVRAVAGLKLKDGLNEVRLSDSLGVIQFRGDGQPRGTLLVTPQGDPGPEGKGHGAVQTAGNTRADLVVPPGDYAVWVVPDSGARARRVVDKVRVHAGKTATAD